MERTSQMPQLLAKIAFILAFYEQKFRDAKKLARQAIEKDNQNATLHALMASICRCSGIMVVAQQAIKQALYLDPQNQYALEEATFIKKKVKKMSTKERNKLRQLLLDSSNP